MDTGITMEVAPAYQGYFKYGEWLPIWVELQNTGPDLDTEIRVSVVQDIGQNTFAVKVSLPSGAHKRLPVYVLPNNYSHELSVELVAENETLQSERLSVKPQPNIVFVTGIISPDRGALSLLQGIMLPSNRSHVLVDLNINELPERSEALRSLNCLIINNVDTSTLTPGQANALEEWIKQGGRLVLGGGAGASQTAAGFPDHLLPIYPNDLIELDSLDGLADFAGRDEIRVPGPFVVATGEVVQGESLAGSADIPLIQELQLNDGYVTSVALDLSVTPFDAWTGTQAFWEALLGPGAEYPNWMPPDVSMRQMTSGSIGNALSNLPNLELPSVRSLTILLIIYIILVGPVNYLVLRWRKNLHLAWVTIPLITLVFSGLSFGFGYAKRGTDLVVNKIAIIRAQGEGLATVNSYIGLFSPANQSYEVEIDGEQLLSPMINYYDPWGGSYGSGSNLTFVQGNPSIVRGLTVNQWSMQSFMTESTFSNPGKIQSELEISGSNLVGTVTSEMETTLEDAVLVLQNAFVHLGDLEPGVPVEVDLKLGNFQNQLYGSSLSWQIYEQSYSGLTGAPGRDIEFKRMVLESIFDQQMMWGESFRSDVALSAKNVELTDQATLFGWLKSAPPEVMVNGEKPQESANSIYLIQLPFSFGSGGKINLPPGFLPGLVTEMPFSGGTCGAMGTSIWMEKGEAVMEYRIPAELGELKVSNLLLGMQTDVPFGSHPDVEIYNWIDEDWSAFNNLSAGVNQIEAYQGSISEDGIVRIRLSQKDTNQMGGCTYLGLGLEGDW